MPFMPILYPYARMVARKTEKNYNLSANPAKYVLGIVGP